MNDDEFIRMNKAQDEIDALLASVRNLMELLDSARDYIAGGGLCSRMVGARELVMEIDDLLDATRDPNRP